MNPTAEAAPLSNRRVGSSYLKLAAWIAGLVAILRNIGPYAAIEIFLPGGTLIAISLWLYRRYRKQKSGGENSAASCKPAIAPACA